MKNILVLLFLVGFNLKPAAQTYETCPQDIPAGYVVISYRACAGCCGLGGEIVQMPTIRRIDHLPPGATIEICPQSIPAGWHVTGYQLCAGCCGKSGELTKMLIISN